MPSGTQSEPACSARPWRKPRSAAVTNVWTRCARTVSELLRMDEPRKRYAGMMSGLDIHYDLGTGHPLLGRRMPDLDVVTESGPRRVFALLYDVRPVLLNLGEPGALARVPVRNTAGARGRRAIRERARGEWSR
ncbi:MAG TPA: hypothetical protein VK550_06530 [Polyangiaceae bacterium]|nr:hypothetical protein [Polyangiaceae bacterium]